LAAILTALDRHSMESPPLFAFTAPAAGTGKSKLVDSAREARQHGCRSSREGGR
jgi:hypothetical protein